MMFRCLEVLVGGDGWCQVCVESGTNCTRVEPRKFFGVIFSDRISINNKLFFFREHLNE
jgi:hypothetical protein